MVVSPFRAADPEFAGLLRPVWTPAYYGPPRWPRPISSTCTSTPSTRSSTGRAGFPTSSRGPPSSRCRPSASPITARWRAPSSSGRRRATPASSRSSAARSTSPTTARRTQKGNAHLTLLAADNTGYANLIKLSSLGYLEGYYYKPRVDWELLERHSSGPDRALRLPLADASARRSRRTAPTDAEGELDRLAQVFGRDNVYVELQNAHLDVQARILPQLVELAAKQSLPTVATGDVHYLRDTDARAHEALLCIQSGDSLKNPNHWKFETDHFYFKSPAGDGARLPRPRWTRCAARSRSPSAATSRSSSARSSCRASTCRKAATRSTTSSSSARRASRSRYDKVTPELQERLQVRAEDDQGDGVHRLLPDRLGLHPLREDARRLRRPGPRLVRRLARRVLARDHRHRPDPLRPDVRALPQPGPQVDARHRHRLRRRRPRARHQLRAREVRQRPRRADHHLLDDGRARSRARRGPRARGAVRRRRQDREADPGRPRPDARRVPQAGRRAAQGDRRRSGREARSSSSRSRSKA